MNGRYTPTIHGCVPKGGKPNCCSRYQPTKPAPIYIISGQSNGKVEKLQIKQQTTKVVMSISGMDST